MGQQPVGREVLVDGSEVQRLLEAAAGTRHARGGVDDDARRLDEAGPHQGGQGQPGRRGVTTGRGDERRAGQAFAEELGQPVDRVGQQLGCGVLLAVPAGIERGVVQPEVGRQVHDQADPRPELRDDPLGLPVGQAAEHQVETIEAGRIVPLVDQAGIGGGQRGRVRADRLAGVGVGRGHRHLELRVPGQQAQQLRPGVPRRPKDPCLHRMSIHQAAYSCERYSRHLSRLVARSRACGPRPGRARCSAESLPWDPMALRAGRSIRTADRAVSRPSRSTTRTRRIRSKRGAHGPSPHRGRLLPDSRRSG